MIFFLILLSSFTMQLMALDQTYLSLNEFEQKGADFFIGNHQQKFSESIYTFKKDAKLTIIYIHGLYGGAQFWKDYFQSNFIGAYALTRLDQVNHISLTLPGHYIDGTYQKNIKDATFEDWKLALDETVQIAKKLKTKIILVGQSTGGLLAINHALKHGQDIAGLFLIEPSIEVQPIPKNLVCVGQYFIKDNSDAERIAKYFKLDALKGHSPKLGCEVSKLSKEMQSDFTKEHFNSFEKASYKKENIFKEMGRKLDIPVVLINNINDLIVVPKANQIFAQNLKKGELLNYQFKQEHGEHSTVNQFKINLAQLISKVEPSINFSTFLFYYMMEGEPQLASFFYQKEKINDFILSTPYLELCSANQKSDQLCRNYQNSMKQLWDNIESLKSSCPNNLEYTYSINDCLHGRLLLNTTLFNSMLLNYGLVKKSLYLLLKSKNKSNLDALDTYARHLYWLRFNGNTNDHEINILKICSLFTNYHFYPKNSDFINKELMRVMPLFYELNFFCLDYATNQTLLSNQNIKKPSEIEDSNMTSFDDRFWFFYNSITLIDTKFLNYREFIYNQFDLKKK